ncbi:MAG TPA: regulatory iron-sulfur-containing complex subunit RicT [Saprospiraceae bacterium]|nr:regulatory iron-sulfur-containing complex subunit RicT [Saprospiraceae bacterium]HMQ83783.1 regulatory iron-sulfur-containing complex subunit RicT [Saprospiraceae bacterium]
MGCSGCTVCSSKSPNGCKNNGCASGGCNRLNTFDWLSSLDVKDALYFDIVEVSFKNGSRKHFFRNPEYINALTGDDIVVETSTGLDVGRISLSGELVRLQMRKKNISEEEVLNSIIRLANDRDLERLEEARQSEMPTMIRARAIARTLGLDMKIGDVEYQGDKRKATFYYTADGRVDFRELIRHFAKEFRVKIEMRQIGARQESSRIGGIGSCGRELCCSTWLTDFKSVTTSAARYQNLAINQAKLSGMCGRLKCCLNYELDTYLDAIDQFPANIDRLSTQAGFAILVKTDIFKRLVYYAYEHENFRGKLYALPIEKVQQILDMNAHGEKPVDLLAMQAIVDTTGSVEDYGDVTGVIELPEEEKRRRKKKKKRNPGSGGSGNQRNQGDQAGGNKQAQGHNTTQGNNRPQGPRPPQKNKSQQRPNQPAKPDQTPKADGRPNAENKGDGTGNAHKPKRKSRRNRNRNNPNNK